jgi:hypothetical protein
MRSSALSSRRVSASAATGREREAPGSSVETSSVVVSDTAAAAVAAAAAVDVESHDDTPQVVLPAGDGTSDAAAKLPERSDSGTRGDAATVLRGVTATELPERFDSVTCGHAAAALCVVTVTPVPVPLHGGELGGAACARERLNNACIRGMHASAARRTCSERSGLGERTYAYSSRAAAQNAIAAASDPMTVAATRLVCAALASAATGVPLCCAHSPSPAATPCACSCTPRGVATCMQSMRECVRATHRLNAAQRVGLQEARGCACRRRGCTHSAIHGVVQCVHWRRRVYAAPACRCPRHRHGSRRLPEDYLVLQCHPLRGGSTVPC